MVNLAIYLTLGSAFLAGLYALLRSLWITRQKVSNERLVKIAGFVSEGAMAFLTREFRALIPFVAITAVFLWLGQSGALRFQSLSFALGALTSALAGFIGMKTATAANYRTSFFALKGLGPALSMSFAGGSVMGMTVIALALAGIALILSVTLNWWGYESQVLQREILPVLSGFSLGASGMALFARVGGGIFTKAADVGADLVGKVEAGIPEDDHRNPAVIADNVGDNVGDVAGMGADLFESYVGSIIGAMILGLTTIPGQDGIKMAFLPLIIAAVGGVSSILGSFLVRVKEGKSPQAALNRGSFGAAILAAGANYFVISFYLGNVAPNGVLWELGSLGVWLAMIAGLAAGVLIGLLTELFTGTGTPPVKSIVHSSETGPATTLITGLGMGMLSTLPPIILISAAVLVSYGLAGLYGVAIAALGMLVTLGVQLAVDAYGPIADNAGGLAEMSEMPHGVREITDKLDAVGNTTAAIGKGFAIGSAALTSIILFAAFKEVAGLNNVELTDVRVIAGLLIGAMIPYLFSSLAMNAIGKAAFAMIEEVRRQFREKPGILEEKDQPDYKRCVEISTSSAIQEMLVPGLIAALSPLLVGFLGGPQMLLGLLSGVTMSGVVLAIFMSNSGGAWDNAKKMIESGKGPKGQGKGSEAHKAAVVGDTVGDPFKDTAGPSINILIKLMAVVSLVTAPMMRQFWG